MRARALAAVLLIAACGREPVSAEDLALRVDAPLREVESGKGFPLTVVRAWAKKFEPAPFAEDALAPLLVRVEETSRREEGDRVEETLRGRGYAFGPGQVELEPVLAATGPAGERRTASAPPLTFRVAAALGPGDAAAPEPPEGPFRPPPRWPLVAGAGVAAAAAAALVVARRRARPAPPIAARALAPPPPSPRERALAALAAINVESADEVFHVALAQALRDYVAEAFAIRADVRTSEELAAAAAPSVGAEGARLQSILRACDAAKFGRAGSGPDARSRLRGQAEAFVRATAEALAR